MKEVSLFFRNKIFLTVEILILLFSSIFALSGAIMVTYGWKKTCDAIKQM